MTSDRATLPGGLPRRGFRARAGASGTRRIAMAPTAPVPEPGQAAVVEPDASKARRPPWSGSCRTGGGGTSPSSTTRCGRPARACFPAVEVVTADAAFLPGVLVGRGIAAADVVIAGRSWAGLPHARRRAPPAAVREVPSPEGAFTASGPPHARFRAEERHFRRMLGVSGVGTAAGPGGTGRWRTVPSYVHLVEVRAQPGVSQSELLITGTCL